VGREPWYPADAMLSLRGNLCNCSDTLSCTEHYRTAAALSALSGAGGSRNQVKAKLLRRGSSVNPSRQAEGKWGGQELVRSEEARYDHRLQGVLMVSAGESCTYVADLFGHSRRTVRYWVRRFENGGFSALQAVEQPGRTMALKKQIRRKLARDLRRSPRDLHHSQTLWDG